MSPRDPYKYFRVEARELLEGLRRGIDEGEGAAGDPARVSLLLRLAHTLKGAARVVKLTTVSDLTHRLEDILAPCRENSVAPSREQQAELRRLVEEIAVGLAGIDRPAAPPPDSIASPPTAPSETVRPLLDTVRLQVAEVDAVLSAVAETAAEVAALRAELRHIDPAAQQAQAPATRFPTEAGGLGAIIAGVRPRVTERVERLDRNLQRLHEDAGRLRLIPTEALWTFLEHAVRDAAQTLGRHVRLETDSRTLRLDAPVVAGLQEALLHLVRNAVAHGIEPESARRAAGKPLAGCIRVRITHSRGRLRVACEDDGGGIDVEAVRRAAVTKGWLASNSATPFDMVRAIQLLLRGGVTTTRAATEMSGRGIGLDIVRAGVARLGGELAIESTPGRGTVVIMDVPVALSAIEALGVENGGAQLLVPLDAVQRVLRAEASSIRRLPQGEELHTGTEVLPFAALHRLLPSSAGGARQRSRHITVVVVRGESGSAALGVDRLCGTTEAVVRPLPVLADAVSFVAGVSLSANRAPRLFLDARSLVEAIRAVGVEVSAPAAPPSPILVVDDSLTTRMLEQSILESAGYTVDLAVSGEDALRRLRERRYGLLLVDVEMPGIDGFTLIEQLRREPAWRDIPAILVTSRDSREDRHRGLSVGAQDYVIKGEFDQRRLLRRIGELLS